MARLIARMRFADARGPEEDHVLLAIQKAQRVEIVELLALNRVLKKSVGNLAKQ